MEQVKTLTTEEFSLVNKRKRMKWEYLYPLLENNPAIEVKDYGAVRSAYTHFRNKGIVVRWAYQNGSDSYVVWIDRDEQSSAV